MGLVVETGSSVSPYSRIFNNNDPTRKTRVGLTPRRSAAEPQLKPKATPRRAASSLPPHDSATYDSATSSVGSMKLLAESWVAESWGKQSFQENERVTDSRAKAQRRGTATQSAIVFLNAKAQRDPAATKGAWMPSSARFSHRARLRADEPVSTTSPSSVFQVTFPGLWPLWHWA